MHATASQLALDDASEPDAGVDALIGAVIDRRYAIEARTGEGGMGIVYRARHVHLGATVALKVLRASLSGAKDAIERLRREA
jgi:serine/threonine-protein kinase